MIALPATGITVHLIDGTFELFRQFYGRKGVDPSGATVGVVGGVVSLLEKGYRHIGVATDHVIESFRNDLYAGYKTGEGIDPDLYSQFEPLERALCSIGITTWATVELEADDALGSAAATCANDSSVVQVRIMSPDKDLAQCVRGNRVVQVDVRNGVTLDDAAVVVKYGVEPTSIADWLALVGDTADGFPGITGWGRKSASAILAVYRRIEDIPTDADEWEVKVRGAQRLAESLRDGLKDALLFKQLATLRIDPSVCPNLESLRWTSVQPSWRDELQRLGSKSLVDRVEALAASA